jgi:hypothetical protein
MAQESVAAVAGELDFMAGFWREGGECCRPQGSVGPASGPDATGARPDLGARDKTESSLPSMLTGAGYHNPCKKYCLSGKERSPMRPPGFCLLLFPSGRDRRKEACAQACNNAGRAVSLFS